MTKVTVSFSIVDVFTRDRFAGNPVAVIHDARALDTSQMQNIAREFGFSETTFILPPANAAHHAQVRIFTPQEEVPFAGHPNIGTVFVMGAHNTAARDTLPDTALLDEQGGDVRIWPIREAEQVVGVEIEAPQPLQKMGDVSPKLVARCLGLAERDVMDRLVGPCVASVGLPFAFVQVRDLDALGAVAPDIPAFREAAESAPRTVDGFAVCAFAVLDDDADRVIVRSRVICPLGHPAEDPATGSASGALGALLAEALGRNGATFEIAQGVEMGRRSQITVDVPRDGGPVSIRGYCADVGMGTLFA